MVTATPLHKENAWMRADTEVPHREGVVAECDGQRAERVA
jgi:hypothetical protein